jgi:hypothetical protein
MASLEPSMTSSVRRVQTLLTRNATMARLMSRKMRMPFRMAKRRPHVEGTRTESRRRRKDWTGEEGDGAQGEDEEEGVKRREERL